MSFKYTDNGKTTKSVGGSTTPQKVWDTLFLYRRSILYIPFQQNAYKVPETKKEGRRRTSQYVEAILMKYTVLYPRSETRSERVWINCAAILTAISAGVSLPISIPMGVITRASCCSL